MALTPLLLTALVTLTALAHPNPILPRDIPQPLGVSPGDLFSELTFTTFAQSSCQGDGEEFTNAYGYYEAFQMKSYSLSRSLRDSEVLDFFTGFGTGLPNRYSVDHSMDADYEDACTQYDATAGVNATTDDASGGGRSSGCHDLSNNEWCANLYQT